MSLLEAVGKDFEKGLTDAVKYLPEASALVALIFPPAAAPLAAATTVAGLLQNAVVMAEQKYAAAGVQTGTGTQKAAEVLQLGENAVTELLAEPAIASVLSKAGITVDSTYVGNLVNAVVGILNVQGAPAAVAA
jgi:hypothetical protein